MKLPQLSEAEQRLLDNLIEQRLESITRAHRAEESALTSDLSRRNIMASSYAVTSFFALGNKYIITVEQSKIDTLDEVLVDAGKEWTADLANALFSHIKTDASRRVSTMRKEERSRWTRMGLSEQIPEQLPQHDTWLAQALEKLRKELNIRVDRASVRSTASRKVEAGYSTHSVNLRFRVALSFSGKRREFISRVAEYLANVIGKDRVLYDKYYEPEFARPSLDTYLQCLYHSQSELIVVFICSDYKEKEWCGLEWRAISDLIKKREFSKIMLLRFDDTEIPGLYGTDGYIPIEGRNEVDVANMILKRLAQNDAQSDIKDDG